MRLQHTVRGKVHIRGQEASCEQKLSAVHWNRCLISVQRSKMKEATSPWLWNVKGDNIAFIVYMITSCKVWLTMFLNGANTKKKKATQTAWLISQCLVLPSSLLILINPKIAWQALGYLLYQQFMVFENLSVRQKTTFHILYHSIFSTGEIAIIFILSYFFIWLNLILIENLCTQGENLKNKE